MGDNARGSMVFGLKSKRATPNSITNAAVTSACRGWKTAKEVLDWESILNSVTKDDVLEAYRESLSLLCDPAKVVACLVCDPGDCKKKAKGLALALGLETNKVFVKENISDSYALVDTRLQAAVNASA